MSTTIRMETPSPAYVSAHHDRTTRAFHWATVVLVLLLYGLYLVWGYLPKGTPVRHFLQITHVSLGLLLTLVLFGRIVWRHMPTASETVHEGLQGLAARGVHILLYALLVAQVLIGWNFRWAQGEPLAFFGLFTIPAPLAYSDSTRHTLGFLHYWTAYAILAVAFFHAVAALFHHYVLRDNVLRRMMGR